MRVTQRKGDIAVTHAVASFTKLGYDVSLPVTESAAYDLILDTGASLRRVQVKYSTNGGEVGLRRIHSNSQGYVIKKIKNNAFDWLYIFTGAGAEYLIIRDLTGRNCITPQNSDNIELVLSRVKL
ncbi:MAG TPA: group I intron-associated PD-(D/E)XK endonuclease [Candidatus Paceibacterota bacterium]